MSDEQLVDKLIQQLMQGSWPVKSKAADTLGKIGDKRAIPFLIDALGDPLHWEIGRRAAEAIGKIDVNEEQLGQIIQILRTTNHDDERKNAAYAIKFLGFDTVDNNARILALLILEDEGYIRDLEVNESNVDSLIESDVPGLISALTCKKSEVRENAARLLGEIGSRKAVDALIVALGDPDGHVRYSANEALGNIGLEQAEIERIIRMLESDEASERAGAATTLGHLKEKSALEKITELLNDGDQGVRLDAIKALGNLGDPRAIEPLVERYKIEEDNWRCSDIRVAMEEIGDPGIPKLLRLMESNNEKERDISMAVLVSMGSVHAIEPLLERLSDSFIVNRVNAFHVLILTEFKGELETDLRQVKDKLDAFVEAESGKSAKIDATLREGSSTIYRKITALVARTKKTASGKLSDGTVKPPGTDRDKLVRMRRVHV